MFQQDSITLFLAAMHVHFRTKQQQVNNSRNAAQDVLIRFILQTKKFLKCDWLRPVVFKPNLKYLHVKITARHMLL